MRERLRARWAIAVLAAGVLVCVAVWLASHRREHGTAAARREHEEAAAPAALQPALVPEAQREAAVDEEPKEPAKEQPRAKPARKLDRKQTEALLRVRVTAKETGAPMPEVRTQLVPFASGLSSSATQVEASRGRPQQNLRTDELGRLEYFVPQGVAYDLWVFRPDGELEQVSVPILRAGETRELDVTLPTAPDLQLHGVVIDASDGHTLSGAEVAVLKGERTTTDGEGRFEVAASSWRGDLLTVALREYETAALPVRVDPNEPITVSLRRAAALEVRVLEAGGGPVAGVKVRVLRRDGQHAFNLAWSEVKKNEWSGQTSADGSCSLVGLPARTPLVVEIHAKGEGALLARDDAPLLLEAGEQRVELRTIVTGSLEGRVVDADGKPLAGFTLSCGMGDDVGSVRKTGTDGGFRFARVPAGTLVLRSRDRDGVSLEPDKIDVLPGARPEPVTLVARPNALEIRGRVLDGDARPCSARVWTSGWGSHQVVSDADGSFVLGPLPPGEFELEAQGDGPESEPIQVRAGEVNVVVRLPSSGSLRGSVLDERGQPVRDARVILGSTGLLTEPWSPSASSRADGSFRIDRIRPGTYRVVASTYSGRVASATSVRIDPGDGNRELELRLSPGATLSLLVKSDVREWFQCAVLDDGDPIDCLELHTDDARAVVVPAGHAELRLWRAHDGPDVPVLTRSLDVASGERRHVELVIEPKK